VLLKVEVEEGHESRRSMEQQLKSTLGEHLHLVSESAAASSRAHAAEEQLLEAKRHAGTTATKLSALKYLCLQLEREGAALRAQLGHSSDYDEASAVQNLPTGNGRRATTTHSYHGNGAGSDIRFTSAKQKPIADFKGLEDMYNRVYGGKKVHQQRASDESDSNSSG